MVPPEPSPAEGGFPQAQHSQWTPAAGHVLANLPSGSPFLKKDPIGTKWGVAAETLRGGNCKTEDPWAGSCYRTKGCSSDSAASNPSS